MRSNSIIRRSRALLVIGNSNEVNLMLSKLPDLQDWHLYYQPLLVRPRLPHFRKLIPFELKPTNELPSILHGHDYLINCQTMSQLKLVDNIFNKIITIRVISNYPMMIDELTNYCTDYLLVPTNISPASTVKYGTLYLRCDM